MQHEAEISPPGCETNSIKDSLSSNTYKTWGPLYTPVRNQMKSGLCGGSETKRLSRQDFDTRQYRTDNQNSTFDKKRGKGTCSKPGALGEKSSFPNNSTPDNACVDSYNNEICKIMNTLYNSPNSSKGNIIRIHHEVKQNLTL